MLEIVGSVALGLVIALASRPVPEVRKYMQSRAWQGYPAFLVLLWIIGTVTMAQIAWGNLPAAIAYGAAFLFDLWQVNLILGRTQKAIDAKLSQENLSYERALEREGTW